jgi:hypothetical protein
MYPAYQLRDVLELYAKVFFTLLNEGYRLQYGHYKMLAQLMLVPHMKDDQRRSFLQQLDWASQPPDAILSSSATPISEAAVERMLKG